MKIFLEDTSPPSNQFLVRILTFVYAEKVYVMILVSHQVVSRCFWGKKIDKPLTDGQGLHDNHPSLVSDETRELTKQHISSFPLQENNYSRSQNKTLLPTECVSFFSLNIPIVNQVFIYTEIFLILTLILGLDWPCLTFASIAIGCIFN